MTQRIEEKYQCNRCGDVHEDDGDADDCCRPGISRVFECPSCHGIHSEKADAVACCGFDEAALPVVSAAELERAGQIRLLP